MTTKERGRPEQAAPTNTPSSAIIARAGDGWRARRIRAWARRELERMDAVDPWSYSTPVGEIDYHLTHLDRSWQEREAIGADMAAAGWLP